MFNQYSVDLVQRDHLQRISDKLSICEPVSTVCTRFVLSAPRNLIRSWWNMFNQIPLKIRYWQKLHTSNRVCDIEIKQRLVEGLKLKIPFKQKKIDKDQKEIEDYLRKLTREYESSVRIVVLGMKNKYIPINFGRGSRNGKVDLNRKFPEQ